MSHLNESYPFLFDFYIKKHNKWPLIENGQKVQTKTSQFCDKIIFELSQMFLKLAKMKIAQNI